MNFFKLSRPESSPVLKKVYAIMRLTTLALIAFSLNISATVYSQKTKLTLDANNQSIKEILYQIRATAPKFLLKYVLWHKSLKYFKKSCVIGE